jgi:hypothetical protein
MEIKNGDDYVYETTIEGINNGDKLTIYPNDEWPNAPITNLEFYY